jgi:hypothetical protein
MRGLELLDAGAVAVLLDDNGQVKTRFSVTNTDLGAAAAAALEKVDCSIPTRPRSPRR